jgi:hypothetical protein
LKTHAATIKQSLIEAGFVLHKCDKLSQWQLYSSQACVRNDKGYLMQSRALGDLLLKAAKEFNL